MPSIVKSITANRIVRVGGWEFDRVTGAEVDARVRQVVRALAFLARTLFPSNSKIIEWCTSRLIAAMVLTGTLMICSHLKNTTLIWTRIPAPLNSAIIPNGSINR